MRGSGTQAGRARRAWRKAAVLSAALAVTCGLLGTGSSFVQPSDASWQRTQVTNGAFAAATVPAARLTNPCRYFSGVLGLGARVEIFWAAPAGYDLSNAQVWASTSGLGSVLAPLTGYNVNGNTRSVSPAGHYVTTVPANLLGGLLGLGSELELSIVIGDHGWTSRPASTATNAGLLAGLGGNCRNLT
jgi:hypothetical protein